jgi:flagellar motor switch protein FliM
VERILSEEEIEALLQAAHESKPGSGSPARLAAGEAVPYDLTSQGRPVRGPLPALDMVDDRFARHLRTTLTGLLRRRTEVAANGRVFMKFEETLAALPTPSCLILFRVEPLKSTGMMVFDPVLVYAVLDAFFGARSTADDGAELRDLTAIEQRILARMARALLEDSMKAWRPIADLQLEFIRTELNPQFVTVLPAHAVVVDTKFGIDLDGKHGHLRTVLAYAALEPLKDRLSSGVHGHEATDDSLRQRLWDRLRETRVSICAELGRGRIRVRDLLALRPGDLLPLEDHADGGAVLRIAQRPKATGKPIVSRGVYAIRVERLVGPGEER